MAFADNNPAPPTLDHIIGQKRAVQQLRTALDAFFNDRPATGDTIAFPHTLLVGPAGTGKSLLSQITALELAANLHEELGQNLATPGHLQGLLMLAEAGDVVFIDEIHEMPPLVQTTLYRALEERRLFLGGNRRSITLPPLTVIGATTDSWALNKPCRDRFKITLQLVHYTEAEVTELVTQRAKRLRWPISNEAIAGIASRGRGVPRIAIRLLESVRRTSRSVGAETITAEHLARMCEIEGYDSLGLDSVERRYLSLLREAQGPLRLNVIATQLSLPKKTVEAVLESELIRLGLVSKSEAGRMLTALGAKHLSEAAAEGKTEAV